MDGAFVTLVMTMFTGLTIVRIWINRFQCAKVIALLPAFQQEDVRRFVASHQTILTVVLTAISSTLRVSLNAMGLPPYLALGLFLCLIVAVARISEGLEQRLATQFLPHPDAEPAFN